MCACVCVRLYIYYCSYIKVTIVQVKTQMFGSYSIDSVSPLLFVAISNENYQIMQVAYQGKHPLYLHIVTC